MNDLFDFYAILLRRVPERVKNIYQNTATRVPDLHVFDAVDGQTFTQESLGVLHNLGYFPANTTHDPIMNRPFLKGQLACWLSHVKLWEQLLAKDPLIAKPYHVIIEDDAIVEEGFIELLYKYASFIEQSQADYISLYLHPGQIGADMRIGNILRMVPGIWGTQCYILPHHRVAWMLEHIKPLRTAIDEQMTRIPNVRAYLIYDKFLKHDAIASEIPLAIEDMTPSLPLDRKRSVKLL